MSGWILPVVCALPLVAALVLALLPKEEENLLRGTALGFSLVTFLVSLLLWTKFKVAEPGFQLVYDLAWVKALGAHIKLGVDGISLWLVLLTTFLTPIVLLSSWNAVGKKVKEFLIAFLILETGMLGTFLAMDLFLFYVFWEVMLIPMYFIIGIWGGERRLYASIKFVIYTMVGSLLMLVAIFYVYIKHGQETGIYTFDIERLWELQLDYTAQLFCFGAFALAFAIKVPLFPLHTWLPDAHVEAPTAGSVILAGVLLKFGVYGFIRLAMPMFPWASHQLAPYIVALAVVGIIYGAFVAFAQEDVKKLIAYSSVSHLGFCILGLFALNARGIEGSLYSMLSHGLTTSGLFLAIGVLYERRHTRKLAEYGGVWKAMPVFGGLFLLVTLGSAGLPGLSGFVGEFLALIGAYDAHNAFPVPHLYAGAAATGVILVAVYLLKMFQRVMFGPITQPKNEKLRDLSVREVCVFLPLVVFIFVMGLYPRPFLRAMEPAVDRFAELYRQKLRAPASEVRILRGVAGVSRAEAPAADSEASPSPASPDRTVVIP